MDLRFIEQKIAAAYELLDENEAVELLKACIQAVDKSSNLELIKNDLAALRVRLHDCLQNIPSH